MRQRTIPSKQGASNKPRNLPKRVTKAEADEIVLGFLERIGSPRALGVWLMYKSGQHRDLVSLQYDFSREEYFMDDRKGIQKARGDYAATRFLTKCSSLNTGIDTREVAIASARAAEIVNGNTNALFACLYEGREASLIRNRQPVMATLSPVLFKAGEIIRRILGDLKPGMFKDTGFSGGRTTSAFGDEKTIVHKYTSQLDVTGRALPIALGAFGDLPHWGQAALDADGPCSMLAKAFELVPGNVMSVVPKNAKTDRVICYEPHCNIRLQLAVGTYLKQRLLFNGINLGDQSINQRRAQFGSKTGSLATIDLKSASDMITTGLVEALIPFDWYDLLDRLRSPVTLWPDGQHRENQKFSSMGNGFTFELESLIFYALSSAVADNVSVYGDDIIIPAESFDSVEGVLLDCGFLLNTEKSFSSGPFRESCGFDGLLGVDITPVYLRSLPKVRSDVVKLHNALREWAARTNPTIEWATFLRSIRNIHSHHLGPAAHADGTTLGDGHYHVNFDEACPQRAHHGLDGWWYKTSSPKWRVNSLYGDRVSGRYSGKYSAAALCASLGPKAVRSVFDIVVDRRLVVYTTTRSLANYHWPSVVWI